MYWLREELKASNPVEPPHELPICTRNKGWHGNVHEGMRQVSDPMDPWADFGRLSSTRCSRAEEVLRCGTSSSCLLQGPELLSLEVTPPDQAKALTY